MSAFSRYSGPQVSSRYFKKIHSIFDAFFSVVILRAIMLPHLRLTHALENASIKAFNKCKPLLT